jgi:hypothetical protein
VKNDQPGIGVRLTGLTLKAASLGISALLMAGCAGNPATPESFRETARGGHVLTKKPESFVVDRPLAAVAATFRKRAEECMNTNLYTQQVPTIGFAGSSRLAGSSKATVLVTAQKMEFYLQVHYKANLASEPDGGAYMFIADGEAVAPGKTRLDIYRTTFRTDVVLEAVKGWAYGTTQACPDPKSFLG